MHSTVIRGWAAIDIVVTLPLVLPPTAAAYISLTYQIQTLLGVTTPALPDPLSPMTLLFASLTGLLGVLWALARWSQPARPLCLWDAIGRSWVGGLFTYFIVTGQIPITFWVFVSIEWVGACHQAWWLRRREGHRPPAPDAR